jgi:hypothetical protein
MSSYDKNIVSSSQFFRTLIDELHNNDFVDYLSIFSPPSEWISQNPITLEVVEENLNKGYYENNHWQFIKDVNESFDILIKAYNNMSQTHKKASELKKQFEEKIDKFMKLQQFCCGQWYTYRAKDLSCSTSTDEDKCKLKDEDVFWRYDDFTFCDHHFKEKFDQETRNVRLNFNT